MCTGEVYDVTYIVNTLIYGSLFFPGSCGELFASIAVVRAL